MSLNLHLSKRIVGSRDSFLNHPVLHIGAIIGWAALFSVLPRLAFNLPLRYLLSSDAEVYANFMQMSLDPSIFARDELLRQQVPPDGMRLVLQFLALVGKSLNIGIPQWSIYLSFLTLVLFLLGLYWLLSYCLDSSFFSFLITFFSVIPVHVLGGSTYGFQALGFLPRDLALALTIYVLLLYFYGIKRETNAYVGLAFLATGVLANGYPPLFFHLFITLLFAEFMRTRILSSSLFIYAGIFLVSSAPAWLEVITTYSPVAPIDTNLLKLRVGYMMAYPLEDALSRYLRRFILYSVLTAALYWPISRWASEIDRRILRPWFIIAGSSFLLAVMGVIVETFTPYTRYVISRTSTWFTLSAMVIACLGLRIVFARYLPRHALWLTVVAVFVIFTGQSNLFSVIRYLRDGYENREQRLAFHLAVEELKAVSDQDDLVIAPSEEMNDIAASLRTYSLRSVYVTYKDGGIVVIDGELARRWYNRYQRAQSMLNSRDSVRLLSFMVQEGIDFAFIPSDYYASSDSALLGHVVARTEQYLIIGRELVSAPPTPP